MRSFALSSARVVFVLYLMRGPRAGRKPLQRLPNSDQAAVRMMPDTVDTALA
jgi:hypothetical protein